MVQAIKHPKTITDTVIKHLAKFILIDLFVLYHIYKLYARTLFFSCLFIYFLNEGKPRICSIIIHSSEMHGCNKFYNIYISK